MRTNKAKDSVLGARQKEFDALVASAARSLDPRERRVVALRYFLDLSQAEIGDAVGLSQVAVSRVLGRALGKMRLELDGQDPGLPKSRREG